MFCSAISTIRFNVRSALAWICAFGAIAILISGCTSVPIPVTSAENANVLTGPEQVQGSIDLGAGYRLETNSQGTRIVAPETVIHPADKTYDLGAGYRLVITANGGEIIPPARPSPDVHRVDLGAGYVLEISGEYGRIIPPSNLIEFKTQPLTQHKEYIGGGFWLITGPDGGKLVQEETR